MKTTSEKRNFKDGDIPKEFTVYKVYFENCDTPEMMEWSGDFNIYTGSIEFWEEMTEHEKEEYYRIKKERIEKSKRWYGDIIKNLKGNMKNHI